jgi:V8-like Glu-specific endopeptidase
VSPSETVERTRRLLPDLGRVREILRTTAPEDLLRSTVRRAGPAVTGDGLELESLPPDPVDAALQAQREAAIEAGQRGIERVLQEGPDASLSSDERFGMEAIVLLVGRPALLIEDGRFLAPPADWPVLEEERAGIERTIRSVGRIEVEGHPNLEWIGTGFLVAKDIVMTNRHVAVEFTAPRGDGRWGVAPGIRARIDFREEHGGTGSAEFSIKGLIGIHGTYDMALFRLDPADGMPAPLPLSPASPAPAENLLGRTVYVVGYPAWDGRRNDPAPMQRLFADIYNVKRLQPGSMMEYLAGQQTFTHDCSTLGGNSGSPVVDLESHRVLGLHFGGRYQESNNAVALWDLRNDPLIQRAGLQFA